jgi:hypothetical protein
VDQVGGDRPVNGAQHLGHGLGVGRKQVPPRGLLCPNDALTSSLLHRRAGPVATSVAPGLWRSAKRQDRAPSRTELAMENPIPAPEWFVGRSIFHWQGKRSYDG